MMLGVPQGSVIGPVLFLVYINDIASDIDERIMVRLFTDDCLLCKEINSPEDQQWISDAPRAVEKWCDQWKMKINENKIDLLCVTNKVNHVFDFNCAMNSSVLFMVDVLKYLGVNIS